MAYRGYAGLRVHAADGIARVRIDHPPINLLDLALIGDLDRLTRELAGDAAVRVVVFESANADFFVAHADVRLLQSLPAEAEPKATALGPFHALLERLRRLPQATIGQVEGIARGGGSELLLSLDMRFAALGRAVFGQPEVAVGIIPGGGGTQRLPRLVGRGRALEIVLGGGDFPADLAERYGWVNRTLPPGELGPFVERLARRIASFPASAIALAKQALEAAEPSPEPGLLEEAHLFQRSLATPDARERMAAFLALGGQTREVELRGFGEG